MQTWKIFYITLAILIVAGLCYLLAPILTPFLMGALLAYLVNPLVTHLMRLHISRLTSVIIIFSILLMLLITGTLLLIPIIQEQIDAVIILIPTMIDWFQFKLIPKVAAILHSQEVINSSTIKSALSQQLGKASGVAGTFISTLLKSGTFIIEATMSLIISAVVTFYVLKDWEKLLANTLNLVPNHLKSTVKNLATECDDVLSGFIRGQFLVMLIIAIYYATGLTLLGIDVGVLLGILLGIIGIVPYLGFITGIIIASIAAYLQFGNMHSVSLVIVLFLFGQVLESTVITPKLIGDRIGLHPIAVILAVLAGGSLFGFFGVLLALPAAAVMRVWLRYFQHQYQESKLYQ